jgi:protein O-mannosyl-transferase
MRAFKTLAKKQNIFSIVCLLSVVFLTYSNVYTFEFVYDDEFFILKNKFLNSFSSVQDIFTTNSTAGSGFKDSFYRPMQFFSYLLVKQTLGSEVWGFHLLNVLIHSFNAILIFLFLKKMKFFWGAALLATLIWATHPIHAECIAYMSATADSMYTFFLLLGLNIMVPHFSLKRMIVGWFCFLLAILSKEAAVLGAVLLTANVFYFEEKRWHWKSYLKTVPFWALSLIYALARKTILNFDGDFSFYKVENIYTENISYRVFTFLATLPEYFKLLIWPAHLSIDRPFPVYIHFWSFNVVLGALMVALAFVALLWTFKKKTPSLITVSFVILWFTATHLLHSGVLLPLNSFFLEHWMYLPSVSLVIMMALAFHCLLLSKKKWTRPITILFSLMIVSACSFRTYEQNTVWENAITLFSHILEQNPSVARARHGLAMAYSDRGQFEKALEEYRVALRQQEYPQTYHNMALIFMQQNQLQDAENYFLKALSLSPEFFPSMPYLMQIYEMQGKKEQVLKYRKLYLQYAPKH